MSPWRECGIDGASNVTNTASSAETCAVYYMYEPGMSLYSIYIMLYKPATVTMYWNYRTLYLSNYRVSELLTLSELSSYRIRAGERTTCIPIGEVFR